MQLETKELKKAIDDYFKFTNKDQIRKDMESLCASSSGFGWEYNDVPDEDYEETLDEILGVK